MKFIIAATGLPPTPEQMQEHEARVALDQLDRLEWLDVLDMVEHRKKQGWGSKLPETVARTLRNKTLCLINHDRILHNRTSVE